MARTRTHHETAPEFRARIAREASAPFATNFGDRPLAVDTRINVVAEQIVSRITDLLEAKAEIITVRARFGLKESFLRPLYTSPKSLNKYFIDPDKYVSRDRATVFDFSATSFSDAAPTYVIDNEASSVKMAFYEISKCKIPADDHLSPCGFGPRIASFIDDVKTRHYLNKDLRELYPNLHCLVAGRPTHSAKKNENDETFHEFMALYFRSRSATPVWGPAKLSSEAKIELGELCELMFDTMKEIEAQDGREFMNEGLNLVSTLIPEFLNTDMAPATKIRRLLDGLEELLRKHLVGGAPVPVSRHTTPKKASEEFPRVHFIDLNFEKILAEEQQTPAYVPKFAVYPRAIAYQGSVHAFLLAHPRNPTIVKWLLHAYCRSKANYKLDDTFTGQFSAFGKAFDKDIFENKFKTIVFSSDAVGRLGAIYQELNQELAERRSNSIAGFIICRPTARTTEPDACGILIFESELPDAFSRSNIRFLQTFVDACEPLIHSVRSVHPTVDFQKVIREAFSEGTGRQLGDRSFSEFIFELVRLDGEVLMKIVKSTHPKIDRATNLTIDDRKKLFGIPLDGINIPDDDIKDTAWLLPLRDRIKWVQKNEETIFEVWKESKKISEVYDFLVNVPSNAPWHCYLNSIPRAVGDREFGAEPTLNPLSPGFSALTMFMLSAAEEIRQIVKLSTRDKISNERDRYREYVRYKVPLAARLPMTAFAFEKSGYPRDSKKERDEDGFGALVSDLVGGNEKATDAHAWPVSLLDQCILIIKKIQDHTADHNGWGEQKDKLLYAIDYHFTRNTILWKNQAEPWHRGLDNTWRAIQIISRIGSVSSRAKRKTHSASDGTESRLKECLERLRKDGAQPTLLRLLKILLQWHTKT